MQQTYNQELDRIYKSIPQKMMWSRIPKGSVAKCFLGFPAQYCHDLQMGLDAKRLDKTTRLLLFEHDSKIMKHIKAFCRRNGLVKAIFFNMSFEDIGKKVRRKNAVTDIKGKDLLQGSKPVDILDYYSDKIDIAFLDFCGQMKKSTYNALRCLLNYNSALMKLPQAIMGFTFSLQNRRSNNFYRDTEREVNQISFPNNGTSFHLNDEMNQVMEWTVSKTLESLSGPRGKISGIDDLFSYKEPGKAQPMIFFLINMKKRQALKEKAKQYTKNSGRTSKLEGLSAKKLMAMHKTEPVPQKRAHITMALRKLKAA